MFIGDQEKFIKEMQQIDELDIETKNSNMMLNPMKVLIPLKVILDLICSTLRLVSNILTWKECYLSYWITLLCLAMSVICAFVPWGLVFLWASRVVVWAILGPWMKLVDWFFYLPLIKKRSKALKTEQDKPKSEKCSKHNAKVFLARENVEKFKEMKMLLFGKYLIRTPKFKPDRHDDIPLPSSFAKKSSCAKEEVINVIVPGQYIVGNMIPRIEYPELEENSERHLVTHDKVGETTPLVSLAHFRRSL
mmetsp:Transcript_2073/g.2123  ORF Transcript_2073/g.2123 Transcript_2073/m.2123 type:complete len:249 (-) Transcript_2073:336-1082(-)